jgi:hypothetical protein
MLQKTISCMDECEAIQNINDTRKLLKISNVSFTTPYQS